MDMNFSVFNKFQDIVSVTYAPFNFGDLDDKAHYIDYKLFIVQEYLRRKTDKLLHRCIEELKEDDELDTEEYSLSFLRDLDYPTEDALFDNYLNFYLELVSCFNYNLG